MKQFEAATIVCNECEFVVRTVHLSELAKNFDKMELTLDVASEIRSALRVGEPVSGPLAYDGFHMQNLRESRRSVRLRWLPLRGTVRPLYEVTLL